MMNDPHTYWRAFCQPNLTNVGSKQAQEDPVLGRQGLTSNKKL